MGTTIGRDLSDRVWLVQGVNMQQPQIVEQGPIVNQVIAANKDGSWDAADEDARAVLVDDDLGSSQLFGLRQELLLVSDAEGVTLEDAAAAYLAEYAQPYSALSTNVLNLPPAKFGDYDIGDTVGVLLLGAYGAGAFESKRRVIGREFYPSTGLCKVILK
jgi:hypothetical protein